MRTQHMVRCRGRTAVCMRRHALPQQPQRTHAIHAQQKKVAEELQVPGKVVSGRRQREKAKAWQWQKGRQRGTEGRERQKVGREYKGRHRRQ